MSRAILLSLLLAGAFLGPSPPSLGADHERLEEIYEEQDIKADDGVSLSEYVNFLKDRLLQEIARALDSSAWAIWGSPAILWTLVLVFGAFLAYQLLRLLAGKQHASSGNRRPTIVAAPRLAGESPENLRKHFEELMAAGKARAALRMLWLLFATELSARGIGRFETETTNREFVDSVAALSPGWGHLRALRTFSSATERLLYSGDPVELDQLHPLLGSAREMLS